MQGWMEQMGQAGQDTILECIITRNDIHTDVYALAFPSIQQFTERYAYVGCPQLRNSEELRLGWAYPLFMYKGG